MFYRLMNEMKKRKISQKQIAGVLELSENTICSRMKGESYFNYQEMIKIRNQFFSEMSLDTLFLNE